MVQDEESAWPCRRPSPSQFSCDTCCTQPSGKQTLRVWIAPGSIHSQADQEAGALLTPRATPAGLNLDLLFVSERSVSQKQGLDAISRPPYWEPFGFWTPPGVHTKARGKRGSPAEWALGPAAFQAVREVWFLPRPRSLRKQSFA